MPTPLSQRVRSPEEEELAVKRAELAAAEERLLQGEVELATMRADLHAFEHVYTGRLASRYAELDEIESDIAAFIAGRNPADTRAKEAAQAARAQAEESRRAAEAAAAERAPAGPRTEAIRDLFRRIAKAIHPDLAHGEDETSRRRREEFMARANAAYARGDGDALEALLREWEQSPQAVRGQDIGSELVRVIRAIANVRSRLKAVESEKDALVGSNLWRLKGQIAEAREHGRDLLAELAADLDGRIAAARQRLATMRQESIGGRSPAR